MKIGVFLHIKEIYTRIRPFDLSEKQQLGSLWTVLEKRADCTFFLSWQWISNWLALVTNKLFLVEAYQDDKVVGLGVFVEQRRKIFGLFPIKQWYLHRTGIEQQDQIWVEYNDFLLDNDIEDEVRSQMISAIKDYDHTIKEFVIGLSLEKVSSCFNKYFPHNRELISTQGYLIDLSYVKENYLSYIPSKNTRSQINRSNKLLHQQGQIKFDVVTDKNDIKVLFTEIAKLHIKRWKDTSEGSGFTNALFTTFHQNLINEEAINEKENTVQISILSLNTNVLGYLVNFVYKENVYFYLSALTTSDNNKIKVGLSLHSAAIQHYVSLNIKNYDFLGGEARYKQSLSNKSYQLAMICFFKNNKLLWLENKLKNIKYFICNAIKASKV